MTTAEIVQLVTDLIQKAGYTCDDIEIREDSEAGTTTFNIKTADASRLIGRGGDIIKAFNHVAQKMVDQQLPTDAANRRFRLDVDDYFEKQLDGLRTKATIIADRVKSFKSNMEMEPMSSYERLIVHAHLAGIPDVSTESTGEGRSRRVVIKYTPQEDVSAAFKL